jgi:hypothetical protein
MLLRQVDRCLGFTKELDRILPDRRNPLLIRHSQESLLRQRIYGLALGYEDLNDHDSLRHDLLWQTATDRAEELGSCSTFCLMFYSREQAKGNQIVGFPGGSPLTVSGKS